MKQAVKHQKSDQNQFFVDSRLHKKVDPKVSFPRQKKEVLLFQKPRHTEMEPQEFLRGRCSNASTDNFLSILC